MAVSKKKLKTLRDIRTLSGKVEQVGDPYMAYMRISILEMEKVRRGKERQSALERIKSIDERFLEIEEEKADLLRKIEENGFDVQESNAGGEKGFRIKY